MSAATDGLMGGLIDGLILAGGEGRRFGGADKGLLHWRGVPFVAHVAAVLKPHVDALWICANRNAERYRAYGTVIDDGRWRGCGPLAGLRAGLAATRSEWLVYAPVDALRLPADLVEQLWQAAQTASRDAAIAYDGDAPVPTCGLLRASLLPAVEAALQAPERALRDLLDPLCPASASWPAGAWVWSVNTVAELRQLDR